MHILGKSLPPGLKDNRKNGTWQKKLFWGYFGGQFVPFPDFCLFLAHISYETRIEKWVLRLR